MPRRHQIIIISLAGALAFMLGIWISFGVHFFRSFADPGAASVEANQPMTFTPFLSIRETPVDTIGSSATANPVDHATQSLSDTETQTLTHSDTPAPTATPTPTPMPTETQTALPTAAPPDPWVDQTLSSMSLEEKIGQMILMGFQGYAITPDICRLIKDLSPGGIVYRKGNVDTPEQLRSLSAAAQDCAESGGRLPLLVALDHEGQYVYRFTDGATKFPAAMAIGATRNPKFADQAAFYAGQELAYSGVNMVLGPVGDVLLDYDNTVISLRSYGGEAQAVAEFVQYAAEGYQEAGVISVIKHFPGHGGTPVDSHYAFPVDLTSKERFLQDYLPPFSQGVQAGAPVIMTSHVAFPEIDPDYLPATLSAETIAVLRDDAGFNGVLLSDSMGMGAITKGLDLTIAEASVKAVEAGVDMLLISSYQNARLTHKNLKRAVNDGRIPQDRINQAVRRILTVKSQYHLTGFPLPTRNNPDWERSASLAYDIGYASVALYRDQQDLVPISDHQTNVLMVGPKDYWGMYQRFEQSFQNQNISLDIYRYSLPLTRPVPETAYLQSIPAKAPRYDLVIVLTWDAHLSRVRFGDTFQSDLVTAISATGVPLIVVGLKSPTDILDFPQIPTYLATFGTTSGQIQALIDALIEDWQPGGENPLPGLQLE